MKIEYVNTSRVGKPGPKLRFGVREVWDDTENHDGKPTHFVHETFHKTEATAIKVRDRIQNYPGARSKPLVRVSVVYYDLSGFWLKAAQ